MGTKWNIVMGCLVGLIGACGDEKPSAGAIEAKQCRLELGSENDVSLRASVAVRGYLLCELENMKQGALRMQNLAPVDDDGWDCTRNEDKAGCDQIKAAWAVTRDAYESIESSIAAIAEDIDQSTDFRYEDFFESGIVKTTDDNLFDGEGVTGMHGIERILWANEHSEAVKRQEKIQLRERYAEPSFPKNRANATDFRKGLVQRLIDDVEKVKAQLASRAPSVQLAFDGLALNLAEQQEKTNKAAVGLEESRYANRTLLDMVANLKGGRQLYSAFRPLLQSKANAETFTSIDKAIIERFDAIDARYQALSVTYKGAIPPAPPTWSSESPSEQDLASDFGKLVTFLEAEADCKNETGLLSALAKAADAMALTGLEACAESE